MSVGSESSSSMISLQRSMHSSQMTTPGPAMSFLTCFWLFPQNEHFSRSPPSPMRATQVLLYMGPPAPARCCEPARGGHVRHALRAGRATTSSTVKLLPTDGTAFRGPMDQSNPSTAQGGRGKPTRLPLLLGRHYLGNALAPTLEDGENLVDHPVLPGALGREELVALDVTPDGLVILARVPGEDHLHGGPHPQDLVGLNLHVRGLPVAALGGRLVDEDAGVGQGKALAL